MGSLCLATDLAMGFPFEHGLHTTLIAMRIADRLGVGREDLARTYYACLLSHRAAPRTQRSRRGLRRLADEHLNPVMYGSRRKVLGGLIRALPDPAARRRARDPGRPPVPEDGAGEREHLTAKLRGRGDARRSGWGFPRGRGPARLPHSSAGTATARSVARRARRSRCRCGSSRRRDAAFQRLLGGEERVVRLVRKRQGHAFDPEVAACLTDDAERILALDDHGSVWGRRSPASRTRRCCSRGGARSRACRDGQFRRPHLAVSRGSLHRRGGARRRRGEALPARRGRRPHGRRAALVHDLGRVAVDARIWQKPAPLTPTSSSR